MACAQRKRWRPRRHRANSLGSPRARCRRVSSTRMWSGSKSCWIMDCRCARSPRSWANQPHRPEYLYQQASAAADAKGVNGDLTEALRTGCEARRNFRRFGVTPPHCGVWGWRLVC
uniref:Uncharacterized protein n=1 Tax=mine drainage metagenome TaxID=410659 RepID=E6QH50_9ZZZZ